MKIELRRMLKYVLVEVHIYTYLFEVHIYTYLLKYVLKRKKNYVKISNPKKDNLRNNSTYNQNEESSQKPKAHN